MKRPLPTREDLRSTPSRDMRRDHFVQRYLELVPKLTLVVRHRMMRAEGDEAIDVVQGLLVAVLERIEQGDALLPVEGLSNDELQRYLIRAVRNHWLDRKRRDGIIQRNYEELFRALEVVPSTPESLLTDSQHREILRQSVAALQSPYRKLLEALLDDDVTLAELSRRRKIRRGTVYTQFHRAIEALRAEWDRRTKIRGRRDPPISA